MAADASIVSTAAKDTTTWLLQQGVLGFVCLMMAAAACFFYWEKRKAEERERQLYERYVTKNESWVEKYNELARAMNAVIESIVKRVKLGE